MARLKRTTLIVTVTALVTRTLAMESTNCAWAKSHPEWIAEWKGAGHVVVTLQKPRDWDKLHCGGDSEEYGQWRMSPEGGLLVRQYAGGIMGICWDTLGEAMKHSWQDPNPSYYSRCIEG